MLATLISATRKLYTVRFVSCVALVGVGFLSREMPFRKYEKTCHVSSAQQKSIFLKKLVLSRSDISRMTRSQHLNGTGKAARAGNDRGAVDMPMGGGGGRQGCVVYEARLSEQGERASIVHPLGAMPCASADCIQVDICHRNITANYITPNNINLPPLALC
jgi:hypothetical protein